MLKKHLKKIVSLVLVTMMAIGMSITAIAAEPYQILPVSEELKFILSVLELKKPVVANLLGILMLIAQPLLL